MFRLHIYDNSDELMGIEKKATNFQSDNINSLFINFTYDIKILKLLDGKSLYTIYFGETRFEKIDYEESGWVTYQENTNDIVYQILDINNFNKDIADDSYLITESEKRYIINKINESKDINDNWILALFIDRKLALMEEQEFIIHSNLKYLPFNIIEQYQRRINSIIAEHQIISFQDDDFYDENIPF